MEKSEPEIEIKTPTSEFENVSSKLLFSVISIYNEESGTYLTSNPKSEVLDTTDTISEHAIFEVESSHSYGEVFIYSRIKNRWLGHRGGRENDQVFLEPDPEGWENWAIYKLPGLDDTFAFYCRQFSENEKWMRADKDGCGSESLLSTGKFKIVIHKFGLSSVPRFDWKKCFRIYSNNDNVGTFHTKVIADTFFEDPNRVFRATHSVNKTDIFLAYHEENDSNEDTTTTASTASTHNFFKINKEKDMKFNSEDPLSIKSISEMKGVLEEFEDCTGYSETKLDLQWSPMKLWQLYVVKEIKDGAKIIMKTPYVRKGDSDEGKPTEYPEI